MNSAFNGTFETFGTLIITQNGSSLSMQTAESGAASCAYVGTLTQYGQTGDVRGSYTCTDGAGGTFEFYEMQVTERSIVGHFRTVNTIPAGCQQAGWFGGISATTF